MRQTHLRNYIFYCVLAHREAGGTLDFRLAGNSLSERIRVIPNAKPFLSLFLSPFETFEGEDVNVLGPTHNSSTF